MIELVDPRGAPAATTPTRLAPGRSGPPQRLGFLCNEPAHLTGPHFEGYTRVLERQLRQRLGGLTVTREVKPVLSRPADDEQLDRLADCDGVVNGLAK